jgi:ribonuclease HI
MARKKKGNIKIFQWNCRSISKNILHFENHIISENYAILALQSLNVAVEKLPNLKNYYYPPLFHSDKDTKKVQSALYIRHDLEYDRICDFPISSHLENIYYSSARVKVNNEDIINVTSVYLPRGPRGDNTDWLKSLSISDKNWLVLGDFNAHSPLWDSECTQVTCNRLIENIVDSKLVLLNDGKITRIPDLPTHKPSAIDLSLASSDMALNYEWTPLEDSLGSDHLPIVISTNSSEKMVHSNGQDKIPKFKYHLANWEAFEQFLVLYDEDAVKDVDLEKYYSNFCEAVISAAEHSIPRHKPKQVRGHSGNVWWTEECKRAVLFKKETFKNWLRNRSEENFNNMKRAKLTSNKVVAQAKKKYWETFCEQEIQESKDVYKVWKKVNEMKKGVRQQEYPIKNEKFPNSFLSSTDKAEAFVNNFAKNSLSSSLSNTHMAFRASEEQKDEYKDPLSDNSLFINAPIQYSEYLDALSSFSSNSSAVGLDAISYKMLNHLPCKWKKLLHSLFQSIWNNGAIPSIWKSSVVVPIHKQGKPRFDINSYRPIALTSHVCKLFEKIVNNRLIFFCEKNEILPSVQAGFRKGRSTTDHLVKLTNQIKKQFSRKKSTLATFFDVRKAYDSVWHSRLLYKLKNIGISGNMYQFFKDFLSHRQICTRVGSDYSSFRSVDTGIPQGSIIAPLLFTILIHDLPKALSKHTHVVQYADDIAIWMHTSLRKRTDKRVVNYVQQLYQAELNNIQAFMKNNGLEFSIEKTFLVLFNNGENPKWLPALKLNGLNLNYSQSVKFLGVTFTTKLCWRKHIDNILNKARKRINLLKIVSTQCWSQNTKTLIHLTNAIVRSTLTYGQEVYFSAAKYLLNKLQSIDSRAYKLALGVPMPTNTIKTYKEIGVLSLDQQRILAASTYVVRSLSVNNSVRDEILIDSKIEYPKRSRHIPYLMPIFNYTNDLFSSCNIKVSDISPVPIFPPIPPWEHLTAQFDTEYTQHNKEENINVLISEVKEHLGTCYPFHLKIFTDGSLLDSGTCGAGFTIPSLDIHKSYHLGKGFSIFTSELYAIYMALDCINTIGRNFFNILLCVDSKSVLSALQSWDSKVRKDILFEIKYLIHEIRSKGTDVSFCWVPSHCGIKGNEQADKLAKRGAMRGLGSVFPNYLHFSTNELKFLLKHCIHSKFNTNVHEFLNCPRHISKIIFKLRLNTWNTKYSKEVKCICNENISIYHILAQCPIITYLIKSKNIVVNPERATDILYETDVIEIANIILKSGLGNRL